MYDGSSEVGLPFNGQVHCFAFRNNELFKLQALTKLSPFTVQAQLASRTPADLNWVIEIIRLGLIAGGETAEQARLLTHDKIGAGLAVSWVDATMLASLILTAALVGPVGDSDEDEGGDDAGKMTGVESDPSISSA